MFGTLRGTLLHSSATVLPPRLAWTTSWMFRSSFWHQTTYVSSKKSRHSNTPLGRYGNRIGGDSISLAGYRDFPLPHFLLLGDCVWCHFAQPQPSTYFFSQASQSRLRSHTDDLLRLSNNDVDSNSQPQSSSVYQSTRRCDHHLATHQLAQLVRRTHLPVCFGLFPK